MFIISLSHPEKLVNLQALHLWLRSLLRRWAAAAQLLQRRRQRSTAAWEAAKMARIPWIFIYIYIYFLLKCSINCFFGFTSALLHLSKAILFMLFICLYFIFVFWWFLHFFTTKLKCNSSSHEFVATGPAREAATRKHSRRAKPTIGAEMFWHFMTFLLRFSQDGIFGPPVQPPDRGVNEIWQFWGSSVALKFCIMRSLAQMGCGRRCQAAELQHRLRLQQFLAQLLKTWCHVARSSCRRREEMQLGKDSNLTFVT